MNSLLRKKSNSNITNKVVFVKETNLKVKGRIVFRRCPAHCVLHVYVDIKNFQSHSERLLPSDFFENT